MRVFILTFLILLNAGIVKAGTISGTVTVLGEAEFKDTVVYLEGDFKGSFEPPLRNPEVIQEAQAFRPTALAVTVGSTVEFPNNDDVFHNAFSFSPSNPFDFGPYGPGREQRIQMKQPGLVEVFCDVHDHMYAYIIVLNHRYFAMTQDGSYTLKGVPEGTYTLKAFLNPEVVEAKTVSIKSGNAVNIDFSLDASQ